MSLFNDISAALTGQPYKVVCTTCGSELDPEATEVDKDLDMTITIEPCQTCINSAVEEAKAE